MDNICCDNYEELASGYAPREVPPLGIRPNITETRNMTIDRVLKDYELCDVAGRLSIIEHAISQIRCRRCPYCTSAFFDDDYKVIPCLCRMHTECHTKWYKECKRPRQCPKCDTEIIDEDDLWDMTKLRLKSAYHYGSDSNDDLESDDCNNNTDEESPRDFVPRAKVPPQSPRRKTKARLVNMRRKLSAVDLENAPNPECLLPMDNQSTNQTMNT